MNVDSTWAWRATRIAAGRLHQRLGWAGIAGVGLALLSIQVASEAWWLQRRLPAGDAIAQADPAHRQQVAASVEKASAVPARVLPSHHDVPTLLGQIARGAALSGLGWPAANYQLVHASETSPASLELRCSFKGAYPKLRAFLDDYLETVPGATVRELSITRPSSEAAEVEAKLVLAVLLQDEALAGPGPGQEAAK